jgi:trehalose 6-phosphate phosphatase
VSLPGALLALARQPLLVVLDYDGTLAPIVQRPQDAVPQPGAKAALARLVGAGHRVAVLTGRRAAEVTEFLQWPELETVGLHGMEWPGEEVQAADAAALEALSASLPDFPGRRLEDKGRTLAVHFREAPEEQHDAIEAALDEVSLQEGWEVVKGKKVREFRPTGFGKGRALRRLASERPGLHPVFIGDDVTDEEGFEAVNGLGGTSIKVGEGATLARHRLSGPGEVVALLNAWAPCLGSRR